MKKKWTNPALETLDMNQTLGGPVNNGQEDSITYPVDAQGNRLPQNPDGTAVDQSLVAKWLKEVGIHDAS